MKIIGIKTKEHLYLHCIGDNSWNSTLSNYLINGKKPSASNLNTWVIVEEEPKTITTNEYQGYTNQRFELRDPETFPNLPKVYKYEDVFEGEYDGKAYFIDGFEKIKSLYDFKQDLLPYKQEPVEFEYRLLAEIEVLPDFTFNYNYKYNYRNSSVTKSDIQFNQIAELLLPKVLLPTQPCSLSKQRSFDIIREHIRLNIDPKVARITSDYDFCLTVQKIIPCSEYKTFRYEGTGKRQKKVEIVKDKKYMECFEIAPKEYQNYTVVTPFEGKNLEDLKKNIDTYLEDLMKEINEPLKECPTCKGYGFVKQ